MCTMILAQYTIRSKQDYIFKTNKIVEIMGASENITDAWDVLFRKASDLQMKTCRLDEKKEFRLSEVKDAFSKGEMQIVELFCGGGNETILFDSMETLVKLNQAFSYEVMTEYPGMIPMCVYTEVTGDYQKDYQMLMKKAESKKNVMIPGRDEFLVPFAMIDRTTFQPYTRVEKMDQEETRLTEESYRKRKVGIEIRKRDRAVKLLDEMVTEKGEESLLAVVHADGNNMGSKIMGMLSNHTDYDFCVEKMRAFTDETRKAFSSEGIKAMKKCQEELMEKYKDSKLKEKAFAFREVIADGDDVTFICNARFAMEYTRAYLNAVYSFESEFKYSSCAGICVFHSHYPFARAYHLAEQCCDDGAKSMVHQVDENGKSLPIEEGWVDFHYIHSGISGDLLDIRNHQGTEDKMARPYLIAGNEKKNKNTYDDLLKLFEILSGEKVSRSDIKTVGSTFEFSEEDAKNELIRIYGHHKELKEKLMKIYKEEELLKALYDLSEILDLWLLEVK